MADEVRGVGVLGAGAEHRERGDDDLHPRADRPECAGAVVAAGGVGVGRGGEEHVGEDVRADLIGRTGVGGGCCSLPVICRRLAACVDDRRALLHEPVVDPHRQHRRQRRDQVGHPVLPVNDADAPGLAAASVAFGEGGGLQRFRQRREARLQPPGTEPFGGGDGEDIEFLPTLGRQWGPGIHDHPHVRAGQRPRFPRVQGHGEIIGEGHRPPDLPLHTPIGHALGGRDLGRDLPQRHLGRPRRRPQPRGRVEGEVPRPGQRPHPPGLGGGDLGIHRPHLTQHRGQGDSPVIGER